MILGPPVGFLITLV